MLQDLTVTILTKNAAETLAATLDSCRQFSDVLVFDTGSSDQTLEIAKSYPNVRIVEEPFCGFGPAHNRASKLARFDWILSIDSDEVISLSLAQELFSLSLDPKSVYQIHRCNYFQGKIVRCCSGWYPDWNVRLFHREQTSFTDALVHETVRSDHLQVISLKGELLHTPYRSIEQLLEKMQRYSTLFAEQHFGKKHSSLKIALVHAMGAFFKNYFLKRGFLGGTVGWILSLHNAQTTYYKYLKLAWRNQSGIELNKDQKRL